ncbi:MAG: ribosomal RNA small subunit methyltransferase A [Euryarchaeota archaeon]|nr:ribosomal RNA small subunit methyltransferase A [Euryarchaeota archaeon]
MAPRVPQKPGGFRRSRRAPRRRSPREHPGPFPRAGDQRFMADPRALGRMVDYAEIEPGDTVLEIGAGDGRLTLRLARRAARVVAIERDPRLAGHLRDHAPPNVEVIGGDARRVPWPPFQRVVSNLPYSATSPLLFRILRSPFRAAVLTVQKEFAERMVATPRTPGYSRLSVMAQHHARVRWMETLPPEAFTPPPRVHSAIVHLQPREPPYTVEDPGLFERLVRDLFGQRRKTLRSSLRNHGYPTRGVPHLERRPEELGPAQLAEVANTLCHLPRGT